MVVITGASDAVITRFAPSPTGYLHLGHVHAAQIAWQAARQAGGRFLLRLEDIDAQRCRAHYAEAILEDLAWLGLGWDGDVRVQSAHMAQYRAALEALAARGLAYPCFCSRAGIAREVAGSAAAPHAPDGSQVYPGTCRNLGRAQREERLAAGVPHAWRLDMRSALAVVSGRLEFHERGTGWIEAAPAAFGDVVLGRRDAPASYHLCVTHDDAWQGVSLVTRGRDLLAATHVHVLLQHVMGWPTPAYAHHDLLAAADGARLSKRTGAPAVRALRQAGLSAAAVLARAAAITNAALVPAQQS
jgi:glutamyl-Q tRNA(Asp) synthetase